MLQALELTENDQLLPRSTNASIRARLLRIVNVLLTAFAFTPLTIFFWISTWDFYLVFVYPQNVLISCSITAVFANVFILLTYVFQFNLQNTYDSINVDDGDSAFEKKINFLTKYLMRLLYSYLCLLGKHLLFDLDFLKFE